MGAWRSLARDQPDVRFLRRAAMAAVEGDLISEAEGFYREAIQQEPKSAMAYFGLGRLLRRCDRLEEAQGLIREGLRLVFVRSAAADEPVVSPWTSAVPAREPTRPPARSVLVAATGLATSRLRTDAFAAAGVHRRG
jgi:hypothetical protein